MNENPFNLGEWIEKVILEKDRLSTENKNLRAAVTRLSEENSRLRSWDETELMRRQISSGQALHNFQTTAGSEAITDDYSYGLLTKESRATENSFHEIPPHQRMFNLTQLEGKLCDSSSTGQQVDDKNWQEKDTNGSFVGENLISSAWTEQLPMLKEQELFGFCEKEKYYEGESQFSAKAEVQYQATSIPPPPSLPNLSHNRLLQSGTRFVTPTNTAADCEHRPFWESGQVTTDRTLLQQDFSDPSGTNTQRQFSHLPSQMLAGTDTQQQALRAPMSQEVMIPQPSLIVESPDPHPKLITALSVPTAILSTIMPGGLPEQTVKVLRHKSIPLSLQQPTKLNLAQQIMLPDRSNETKLVKRGEKYDFEVKRGRFVKDPSGRYIFKFTIPLGPAARTYYYLLANSGHETKKLRKRFKCAVHVSRIPLIPGGPVGMKDFQAFIELSSETEENVKQAAQEILRAVNSMPDNRKRYEVKFPPPPYVAQAVRDRLLDAGGAVIKRLMTENNCHIYCQRAKGKIDILVGSDSERNFQKGVDAVLGIVDSILKDGSKMRIKKVGTGYEVSHFRPGDGTATVVSERDSKEQSFNE